VRAKIAWILSREYWILMAQIGVQIGACTSPIAKAIRKKEGARLKCQFSITFRNSHIGSFPA